MKKRRISKNVFLLGLVSFFNDLSSDMITPILPLFIASLGGSGLIIGVIGGVRDSVSSILKVFSGFWSDKLGKRKVFVFWGYVMSEVFKFLLAFSIVWQHVLFFISFERFGKGLRNAPRDAIIAESMPKAHGRGFGFHKMMDTLGAIGGSILVLVLFWVLEFSFKKIIIIAALIGFISLVPLFFVKEKKKKKRNVSLKIGFKELPLKLKRFLLVAGLFSLANFSYMFFILKVSQSFTGKLAVAVAIMLYILFSIFFAGFTEYFGILSDKIGRRKVIVSGYLLFGLVCFGFAFFNSLIAFIILFALYGISFALYKSEERAFISDLSSDRYKGLSLGMFHTTVGILSLPASLIAGALWLITPQAAFIYGGVTSFASVMLFLYFNKHFKE